MEPLPLNSGRVRQRFVRKKLKSGGHLTVESSYFSSDITLPVTSNAVCSPSIEVVKTAITTGDDIGDSIIYTIEVENTGNVTLNMVALDDTMTYLNGPIITPNQILVLD